MVNTKWRLVAAAVAAMSLIFVAAPVRAQHERREDVSVAGRWMVLISGPHRVSIRMSLEQDKTAVKGTLEDPHGGEFQLAGTFIGHKLTLATTSGSEMELAGELKGDGTLAGSLSGARGDFEWTATRVAGSQ